MMARCFKSEDSRPPQVMRPPLTGKRLIAARSSVVLPAPLGPISTVGGPGEIVSVMPSRIVSAPAVRVTLKASGVVRGTTATCEAPAVGPRPGDPPRPEAPTAIDPSGEDRGGGRSERLVSA